jgi:hypothetical protein
MSEPAPVIVPPEQAAAARRLQVFYQLGMPGMTLMAPKLELEKPKPIVTRCGCGRPISPNKTACRFCYELRVMQMAEKIESQAQLDDLLADLDPSERAEALKKLQPYLKLTQPAEIVGA